MKHDTHVQNNSKDLSCSDNEGEGEHKKLLIQLFFFFVQDRCREISAVFGLVIHSLPLIVPKVVSKSEQAHCSFKKSAMNQKAVGAACVWFLTSCWLRASLVLFHCVKLYLLIEFLCQPTLWKKTLGFLWLFLISL